MADILLGTLRDYWKGVYDWVTGASASKPEISIPDTVDINEAGSNAEIASSQDTQVATTVQSYTEAGASQMEVYVESGSIRVRTDGNPATVATGEPIGNDFYGSWAASGISVYFVEESTITIVSR